MRFLKFGLVGALLAGLGCDINSPLEVFKRRGYERQHRIAFAQVGAPWLMEFTSDFAPVFAEYYRAQPLPSTAKYYNLGNAHFLADQLPEAILAYQRGLRLDPNDHGLRDNLEYARARVQSPFGERGRPEEDIWPNWLYRPSAFQVLVVALVLYSLACLLLTRWWMTRRRTPFIRAAVVAVLAAAMGGFWLHLESDSEWRDDHPLVVIRHERTPLRKGNGPTYPVNPDLPFLSRGMEARKLHERGDWLQIRFASGAFGWVEKGAVLVNENGLNATGGEGKLTP